MLPHYLVKCTTSSSTEDTCVLHCKELVVVCCKWNVRQATLQQMFISDHLLHENMLPVFFATDQLHRPPSSAEIQPMSQQDASGTRPYRGLVLDTCEKFEKKDEKFVHFQAVTFFSCGGYGSNSLFSSEIT